tara:strand:+ start:13330 stop:15756 length:2427 start_codon:yes stop_codon:yes gene_type:complete
MLLGSMKTRLYTGFRIACKALPERGVWIALGSYVAFYLLFFGRSFSTGRYIAPSDSFDFGLSAFLSRQEVWTEYLFSGYPIGADPQALMWYPVFRMFVSVGYGWNLFLVAPFVIASFTCFLFVRHLGASSFAALFSGVVYGFSSTLMAHIPHFNQLHVAAWMPLLPYGISLVCHGKTASGVAVGSIGLALMVLAGHPQLMVYCVYLSTAYLAYRLWIGQFARGHTIRTGVIGGTIFVLGFGLAAIQLLPAQELAALSNRAVPGWKLFIADALHPIELVTIFFPHAFGEFGLGAASVDSVLGEVLGSTIAITPDKSAYVGLLPLFLLIFGGWYVTQYRSELLFWMGACATAVLLTLGPWTPLSRLVFYLPLYGSFQSPGRHFFIFAFGISVAAGLVLSHITSCHERWFLARRAMLFGSGLSACVGYGLWYSAPEVRQYLNQDMAYLVGAYLLPVGVLSVTILVITLCIRRTTSAIVFAALLTAVHVGEMFAHHFLDANQNLQYAEIRENETQIPFQMEAVRETLRVNQGRIVAVDGPNNPFVQMNMSRAWEIPTIGGKDPLVLSRYAQMLDLSGAGDLGRDILSTEHLALDLLDVRYVLIPEAWLLAGEIQVDDDRWVVGNTMHPRSSDPDDDIPYVLMRNNRARSPAWLVPDIKVLTPNEMRVAVISSELPDGTMFDPSMQVLIESGTNVHLDSEGRHSKASCGSVAVGLKTSHLREYVVNSRSECFLVISEVFYPWWQASINGKRTTLIQSNHALLGLVVPSGDSRVRLTLFPQSLYAGAGLTSVSLVIWLWLFGSVLIGRIQNRLK